MNFFVTEDNHLIKILKEELLAPYENRLICMKIEKVLFIPNENNSNVH